MALQAAGDMGFSYGFQYSGPDVRVREIGLRFAVPLTFDRLAWKRKGEWSWYPEDHIGALTGTARAHSGRVGVSPPDWPFAQDDSPMGTAGFRSTKRNITEASIEDEAGRGLSIRSDGSQHVRAAVESHRIAVFV